MIYDSVIYDWMIQYPVIQYPRLFFLCLVLWNFMMISLGVVGCSFILLGTQWAHWIWKPKSLISGKFSCIISLRISSLLVSSVSFVSGRFIIQIADMQQCTCFLSFICFSPSFCPFLCSQGISFYSFVFLFMDVISFLTWVQQKVQCPQCPPGSTF